MRGPAVFLDRDGTINEQMGYINHITRFVLLPGVPEAIRLLNRHGYLTIVVSNQSGVARGYFPLTLVEKVHAHMRALLEKERAVIDDVLFCPHYPGGSVAEYSLDCPCRKPEPGLIHRACKRHEIDLSKSYVIGDRCTDLEMAQRGGIKGILVKTGYGLGDMTHVLPRVSLKPAYIAENLLEAAQWIVGVGGGRADSVR